jgi:transposase
MCPELSLFDAALGLSAPWHVSKTEFRGKDPQPQELHLYLDFDRGGRFPCPECGQSCPAYDTEPDRVWRHLNFFQHKTFLHARFPRLACPTCGIKTLEGPWARSNSGFTLLFEAYALLLAKQMAVSAAARLLGIHDTRLWRLIEHYVEEARSKEDWSEVTQVGVDETACHRGHEYISVFADLTTGKVLFATEGKDADTVAEFKEAFEQQGGRPSQVEAVSLDMSPAFQSGVSAQFPQAVRVFDRFHVMQVVNDAVDATRREEVKTNGSLKGTRYLWLKNPDQLNAGETARLEALLEEDLATGEAYQMKLRFQTLWDQPDRERAQVFLSSWLEQVQTSRLGPAMQQAAQTIRNHSEGILNYFQVSITNGLVEGLNSLLQAVKSKARGYRNSRTFILITYLLTGQLDLGLPILDSG